MIGLYLPELFGMCDRLAVMSRGRLSPVRPIRNGRRSSCSTRRLILTRRTGGPLGLGG